MAGLATGAGPSVVNVYHEKSRILPDVSRVLACLYEKDVKFEAIKASYKDLLSLQASRSVPVPFYDGPVFLQDSRAICRYIAENYEHQGYPFLLGKDVLERASIEQWLRHEEHAFDPPSRALFCHLAFPPQYEDSDDHEGISQEMRKLEEVLEVYEQRLGEAEFLAGNKFTLADLVHLPGTHHVITSDRFAYLYDSRKNVQRWWNKISARDSWQQVLRDMKTVEEQHELEKQQELEEKQKQELVKATLPTFGGRYIRIDPRQQEGTKPQTVLVAPPSVGTISTSIQPDPQDHETTSDQKPSSNQRKQGGFFTSTEKQPPPSRLTESTNQKTPSSVNATESTFFTPPSTPSSAKTHQQTSDDKPTSKTDWPPRKTSSLAKPSSQDSPKISRDSEIEKTTTSVSPQDEKPIRSTYTTSDRQTPQTPYMKPSEQRGTDTSVGPQPNQELKSVVPPASTPSKGDATNVIDDVDRFSTKWLRAVFDPDIEDSQYPSKQEEAPADPRKHSDVHDREKKPTMIPDSGKSDGSSSPDMRAPHAPITSEERSAILPPKGRTTTTGAEKSPFNQQLPPGSLSTDKTAGVYTGAPKTPADATNGSAPVHGADSATIVSGDGQTEKSFTKGEIAQEATPRKVPPADSQRTSAPVEEVNLDARVKQGPAGRGEILNVQDTGGGDTTGKTVAGKRAAEQSSQQTTDALNEKGPTLKGIAASESTKVAPPSHDDTTKKPVVGKRAAEPRSQQTTESIKGISPSLRGMTTDESTKAAPTAPVQAPSSGEQNTPTVAHGSTSTYDINRKEGVKPPPGDSRGTLPTTPGRTPIPATKLPTASGNMSAQSPELPLYTRDEKTEIAESSQTSTTAPNEKLSGRVLRSAEESSSVSSQMKSQEYSREQDGQSGTKLVDNRMMQGDDAAPNAKTGKHKEEDYIANANKNNNRKGQTTTTDAPPSTLQIQSGKNKPETSNDGGMGINETTNSRGLETSREPSYPEESIGQQQIQENRPSTSLQDNVKKSTDAPLPGSETEQHKKNDVPMEDKNNRKFQGES